MGSPKIYSVDEIRALYQADQPKYIALVSPSGQYEVMFNNPKLKSSEKFKEIEKTLKKKSLPDGVYFFVVKNSFSKTATEYKYPVGVGNYSLSENSNVVTPPVPGEKIQTILTPSQVVDLKVEVNRLKAENDQLKKTIEDLEQENEELNQELEKIETLQDNNSGNSTNTIVEKIIEVGTPILNKWFEQRDQELKLLSQRLQVDRGKQNNRVSPDDPSYMDYLNKIIASQDQEAVGSELLYLKNNHPQFYSELCTANNIPMS